MIGKSACCYAVAYQTGRATTTISVHALHCAAANKPPVHAAVWASHLYLTRAQVLRCVPAIVIPPTTAAQIDYCRQPVKTSNSESDVILTLGSGTQMHGLFPEMLEP